MPPRPTLRQLDYLVAVAEQGSVAAAARALRVSSPSISTALAELEAAWGLPLFVRRHAQALTPTPAGRRLAEAARGVLRGADALAPLAADLAGGLTGPLGIGCLSSFAAMVMPELRASFEAGAPDVRVAQVEDDHEGLMARLLDGALDLALTYDLPRPPGIGFEPLAALAPHVMLAAGHPLAAAAFVTPADLAPHPMVLLDLPGSTGYFLSGFEAAGLAPRVAVRTADMALARSMVANGFGYGLVNVRPLSDLAPDGKRVEYRPLRDGPGPLVMGLARAEGAGRTRVVAAFEAHARARITPDGIPGLRMGG